MAQSSYPPIMQPVTEPRTRTVTIVWRHYFDGLSTTWATIYPPVSSAITDTAGQVSVPWRTYFETVSTAAGVAYPIVNEPVTDAEGTIHAAWRMYFTTLQ